jgi:hypothetical protein
VPRTSAGMFTVSYTCAIIIPTISGALWDVTGTPWTAFLPLCLCAVGLTVFGAVVVRHQTPAEKAVGRRRTAGGRRPDPAANVRIGPPGGQE